MNNRKSLIIRSMSIAFLANFVSLLGSTLLTLVLPKFLGISQYAYYQLYAFYVGYLGFLGFGWIEGVYLRHGGQYYDRIDKSLLHSQFKIFYIFESALSVVLIFFIIVLKPDIQKEFVYIAFCLCIVIYLPRALLHNILQAVGRIKEYATGVIIEKAVQIMLTILGVFMNKEFFTWFIASELIGRLCAAIYIFYICRDIVFSKPAPLNLVKPEVRKNMSCGIALMIANVASLLIIGIMRQAIEIAWDIETFGKVSLTLSISNMVIIFINSVALVLFPVLRRSNKSELTSMYNNIRTGLMIPILGLLLMYYPAKIVLSLWLPQYSESLLYMAVLFPMCVYESKMSMLINTFMKTLRKEKSILAINLITVTMSVVFAIITCGVLQSLNMAIFSIVILLALRCILAELVLSKYIDISIAKDVILELILVGSFIVSSWFIGGLLGVAIYLLLYIFYLIIKRRDLCYIVNIIRSGSV